MDYTLLAKTPLFKGTSGQEIVAMLHCLNARTRSFAKGERILHMGDMPHDVGLVLSGSVRIESVDAWGNVTVLSRVEVGQVFAEAYACAPGVPMLVDAVAAQDCEVLLVDVERVTTVCSNACAHHARVLRNLLEAIARKNIRLSQRALHTSPKTIRGKVLSYLSSQAAQAESHEFDIPFNRQELADYLGVDRSALSAELGRMQKAGIIATRRSHFVLKESPLEPSPYSG